MKKKKKDVPSSRDQAGMQMQKEQQLSQGSLRIESFHLSAEFPHLLLYWHHRGERSAEHGGSAGRGPSLQDPMPNVCSAAQPSPGERPV